MVEWRMKEEMGEMGTKWVALPWRLDWAGTFGRVTK